MLTFKSKVILGAMATALTSSMAFAAPAEAPSAFVKRIADQLVAQLKQSQGKLQDQATVNRIVNQNIAPYIDEQGFTRLVMGQYYSSRYSTPVQRAQFSKNFREVAINQYGQGLSRFSNNAYTVRPYRGTDMQHPVVQVDVRKSNGDSIPVGFRLSAVNNQWKIYNVSVSGVDLGAAFRDQFKANVQKNAGNLDKAIASFKPDADKVKN